jgi:hypothetical protein
MEPSLRYRQLAKSGSLPVHLSGKKTKEKDYKACIDKFNIGRMQVGNLFLLIEN